MNPAKEVCYALLVVVFHAMRQKRSQPRTPDSSPDEGPPRRPNNAGRDKIAHAIHTSRSNNDEDGYLRGARDGYQAGYTDGHDDGSAGRPPRDLGGGEGKAKR